jgi:DNA-damage-inducible protein D
MLGEASTTEITRNKDAQGYDENRDAAVKGGSVAGRARRDLEKESGKRIASKENYKALPEAVVRKRLKKKKD